MRSRWRVQIEQTARHCGDPAGTRILHVSDIHNHIPAMRLVPVLASALNASVTVNTGDVSGIGGGIERLFLQALMTDSSMQGVFAPGNHDSAATSRAMRGKGYAVMGPGPHLERVANMSFWGYPDPNRTRLFSREDYRPEWCRQTARLMKDELDGIEEPLIVVVHNELMILDPAPNVRLVLSGHFHSPRIADVSGTTWVRCGSTGGGGPTGKHLHFAVVDVGEQLTVEAVHLVQLGVAPSWRRAF